MRLERGLAKGGVEVGWWDQIKGFGMLGLGCGKDF
jgi:hypothetical protein